MARGADRLRVLFHPRGHATASGFLLLVALVGTLSYIASGLEVNLGAQIAAASLAVLVMLQLKWLREKSVTATQ